MSPNISMIRMQVLFNVVLFLFYSFLVNAILLTYTLAM